MRSLTVIAVCLVAGCSRTTSDPAPRPDPAPIRAGLYTDEEIRKLAKFDVDKQSRGDRGIFDVPCLDVVPPGESHPRARVFKALKIDDARVRDFRQSEEYRVVFLTWQVSPSYDVWCMTATNDPENRGLEMTDPRRKVYGIRLLKRSE